MKSVIAVFVFSPLFALAPCAAAAPTVEEQRIGAADGFHEVMRARIQPKRSSTMPQKSDPIADIESFYAGLEGEWRGRYHLWLYPGAPDEASDSTARITRDGGAWVMGYRWAKGDQPHDGKFEFKGSKTEGGFAWTDTFHSASSPMRGTGKISEDGRKVTYMSVYSAGEGQPEWSWRTEIVSTGEDRFLMEAYNITPEGQEALAVRCEYARN